MHNPSFSSNAQPAKERDDDARARFMARRGRGKGGRERSGQTFAAECDEHGNVFDPESGEQLGSIVEQAPAEPTPKLNEEAPTGAEDTLAESLELHNKNSSSTETQVHLKQEQREWSSESLMMRT